MRDVLLTLALGVAAVLVYHHECSRDAALSARIEQVDASNEYLLQFCHMFDDWRQRHDAFTGFECDMIDTHSAAIRTALKATEVMLEFDEDYLLNHFSNQVQVAVEKYNIVMEERGLRDD